MTAIRIVVAEVYHQSRQFLRQLAELQLHLSVLALDKEARMLGLEIYRQDGDE